MKKIIALRSGFADISMRVFLREALPYLEVNNISSDLKRQALLFDQIGIYNAMWVVEQLKKGPLYVKHSAWLNQLEFELEWLKREKIIIDLDDSSFDAEYLAKISPSEHWLNVRENIIEMDEVIKEMEEKHKVGIDKFINTLLRSDALKLRLMTIGFANSEGVSVYPSLQLKDYQHVFPETQKTDVVSLVIKNLPLPCLDTPWEQIVDYRANIDSRNKLIALRRWMTKVSSGEYSQQEIEEEIEWLVNEFQNYMRLHKMKTELATIETIIKTPLEIIENLIKLRWSKILEPFFALKKRQIALMEAEINAPGREIAYIVKAKEEFPEANY